MLRKAVGVTPMWQFVDVSDSLTWNEIVYLTCCEVYLWVMAMDLQRKDL